MKTTFIWFAVFSWLALVGCGGTNVPTNRVVDDNGSVSLDQASVDVGVQSVTFVPVVDKAECDALGGIARILMTVFNPTLGPYY